VQNAFVEYDPVNNPEQALFSFQISKGIPNGYLRVSRFDTLYPNATEAFNPSFSNEGVRITLWGDRKIPRMRRGSKTEE
jgi:hypothetical protein